ncbi:glycosyltransferase family 4 protein [Enterococcus devriesei]|uniref:Glycosyl transferase family 1 domain-containing protein n=1 Tax=Enterococcus devriesei TaxID=319970 RepID=A0A1L8SYG5_9ENTE|nr:glycosyltransferase family 4 protein [Enterococcus devriesei]OJG37077.1 hypothetical protein RV00_GL000034 [Enterococcus devriesei]
MKKILLLSNMYPSDEFPHYGVFVQNTEKILKECDVNIKKIVIKKKKNKVKKFFTYINFFLKSLFYLILKKFDFVYVHYPAISGIPLLISSFLKKQKIIINIHGNDLVPESRKDMALIKITLKLLDNSHKIIVPSEYFKQELLRQNPKVIDKIHVFPSGGINKKVFYKVNRAEVIESLKIDKEYMYIGYISRIEKSKGWDIFLKMISQMSDPRIKFIVVGSGAEQPQFDKMVDELNISDKIIKYDFLSQKEMNYVFNALEIFVFPTYRKSESLGLVGLESMCTNSILLAANNYGPISYVEDEKNGFLFKSRDVDDLIDKIKKILFLTKDEKKRIHEKAIETTENYSSDKLASEIKSVFEVDN